ncbi:Nek protein kinase, partial [Globisporangium splendens]
MEAHQSGQENEKTAAAATSGAPVVRRKKTRMKDVPSPEDTPPPSSRPPSSQQRHQQQEDTSSNSSSRPPSSQRSTANSGNDTPRHPDETKQKQLETRMEFLYERLKLLQYEKALRKRISCKHFLEDSRSLPQVNPQTRFNDVSLEATRRSFQMPCYPKESVEEMDAQDHLEVGAEDDQDDSSSTPGKGDWGDSTASAPGYEGGDDPFAKWLVVKDEKPANESDRTHDSQHTQMIHSPIDPVAWRRELERMTPKLRDRMAENLKTRPKVSSWHARIDMLHQNVGQIVSKTTDTLKAIADAHKVRQAEGMRIETVEKRVNERFRSTRRKYHERFTKLAQNQDQIEQRQRRVNACTLELTRLQSECATADNEVKSQNDRLTDNSALFALKTQLKRVEQENEQFAAQLEVLRYYLLQKQQLQQVSARARLGKG